MIFVPREVTVAGSRTIYRVYEPPQSSSEPLPVILFLHGAGESGNDGIAQTTVGIGPALRRDDHRYNALVVFPQASRGYGWREFNLDAAVAALDDVERRYRIDPDRVCVTGISMGGYGAWLLALQQPERFSAVVPVCGGLDLSSALQLGLITRGPANEMYRQAAKRLASLPQWVFHGDADTIIPVDESRRMVRALRDAGANVRYSEYRGVRHNSWDRAYAEPELPGWMLAQRRGTASR